MSFRRILILTIIMYAIVHTLHFNRISHKIYGSMFFHRSYINNIEFYSYSVINTMDLLEKFNEYGDYEIVKYEGTRPINIYEMPLVLQLMYPQSIGLAFLQYDKCDIYMKPGLDALSFKDTLYHEYLHCFGYEHVDDPKDLMYYAEVPIDKEESIRYYAKDMKERYYVQRFYRF